MGRGLYLMFAVIDPVSLSKRTRRSEVDKALIQFDDEVTEDSNGEIEEGIGVKPDARVARSATRTTEIIRVIAN